MAKREEAKGRGRPIGSKTQQKPIVEVVPTRCPVCGSTDRAEYSNRRVLEHAGIAPDGRPYTRVAWQNTVCRSCGQVRIDKTYEADAPE